MTWISLCVFVVIDELVEPVSGVMEAVAVVVMVDPLGGGVVLLHLKHLFIYCY